MTPVKKIKTGITSV